MSSDITDKISNVAKNVSETVSNAVDAVKPSNVKKTVAVEGGKYLAKKAVQSKPSLIGAGIGGVVGAVIGGSVAFLLLKWRRKGKEKSISKHYNVPPGAVKDESQITEGVREITVHIGSSISFSVVAALLGSLIGIYIAYLRPAWRGYKAVSGAMENVTETIAPVKDAVMDTAEAAIDVIL